MQKRTKVIVIAVAVLLLLCAVGTVLAKYINEQDPKNGEVRAYNFYFTSNLLDGKEHTLAPDSTSVTFTVGNHADDLRFSEVDIDYTIKVLDSTGAEATEVTKTNSSGTLTKGSDTDPKHDATVTISNLTAGKKYTVTAVGKSKIDGQTDGGYTKTLTATIVVPLKAAKLFYYVENINGYTLLTVYNEGEIAGNVSIKYTGIPDNTNPNMGSWTTPIANSSITQSATIAAHQSLVFRFFSGSITVTGAEKKQP